MRVFFLLIFCPFFLLSQEIDLDLRPVVEVPVTYTEDTHNFVILDSTELADKGYRAYYFFNQVDSPNERNNRTLTAPNLNVVGITSANTTPHNPLDSSATSTAFDSTANDGYWMGNGNTINHFTWPGTGDITAAGIFRPENPTDRYFLLSNEGDANTFHAVTVKKEFADIQFKVFDDSGVDYIVRSYNISHLVGTYIFWAFVVDRDIGGGLGNYKIYINGVVVFDIDVPANSVNIVSTGKDQAIGLYGFSRAGIGRFDLSSIATSLSAWTEKQVREYAFLDHDWTSLHGQVFRDHNPSTTGFVFHQGILGGDTLSHAGITAHSKDTSLVKIDIKTYQQPVTVEAWYTGQEAKKVTKLYPPESEFVANFVTPRFGSTTWNISCNDSISFSNFRVYEYEAPRFPTCDESTGTGGSFYNQY